MALMLIEIREISLPKQLLVQFGPLLDPATRDGNQLIAGPQVVSRCFALLFRQFHPCKLSNRFLAVKARIA
jgi:hypothetical protein